MHHLVCSTRAYTRTSPADADGKVKLWDLRTLKCVQTIGKSMAGEAVTGQAAAPPPTTRNFAPLRELQVASHIRSTGATLRDVEACVACRRRCPIAGACAPSNRDRREGHQGVGAHTFVPWVLK
jgi:hypothetical protein